MFKDLKHQNINCFNYLIIKHLPLSLLKNVSCSFLDRFFLKIWCWMCQEKVTTSLRAPRAIEGYSWIQASLICYVFSHRLGYINYPQVIMRVLTNVGNNDKQFWKLEFHAPMRRFKMHLMSLVFFFWILSGEGEWFCFLICSQCVPHWVPKEFPSSSQRIGFLKCSHFNFIPYYLVTIQFPCI
jgi:hypothetical protein